MRAYAWLCYSYYIEHYIALYEHMASPVLSNCDEHHRAHRAVLRDGACDDAHLAGWCVIM